MNVELREFQETAEETEKMCRFIRSFWKEHNGTESTEEEAREDLKEWTKEGHRLFFLETERGDAGFVHLGSRGAEADWLEDLFVLPEYQGAGIGRTAIRLVESLVREYSTSLYLEVAARNDRALSLYRSQGFDCLNTVTLRKDFRKEDFTVRSVETLSGNSFEIKESRNSTR